MDWSQSYSTSWRVFKVNRATWADADQITSAQSVDITKTADGSLLESGSMDVTGEFDTDYYRIVMTAEQSGDVERVDVATLLFDVNSGDVNRGVITQKADGYSVLYPASKTAVLLGEYAPAGVDGAQYAADLLKSVINAPVSVEGSFTLNDHVVHEIGSNVLDAAWAVLNAGNFVIQIDGRGIVHILPQPTEPTLTIDNDSVKLLQNGISYDRDISEIPNRYIILNDDSRTVIVNDDPASEVSTVNRGFFVDSVDESPTPINGETIEAYGQRRLRELSKLTDKRKYTREYAPNVNVYSIVRASINGLEGDLKVTDQSIKCGHGLVINETAYREISLWT